MLFQKPWPRARRSPRLRTHCEPPSCARHETLTPTRSNQTFPMKTKNIENIVVDEVHARTYVVMADRVLTDGELYKAIRLELRKRADPVGKGERLVITAATN